MMLQIAPRTVPNFLGPEFNKFLFALVGTDRFGGQLSVVSALARQDLDAWAEAATLSRLPREMAVTKLSMLLRRYPEIPQMTQDANTVAARLIALLPRAATSKHVAEMPPSRWAAISGAAGLAMRLALSVLIGLQYANQTAHHASAAISQALHSPTAASSPQ